MVGLTVVFGKSQICTVCKYFMIFITKPKTSYDVSNFFFISVNKPNEVAVVVL